MSRERAVASALNDLSHLFCNEDGSAYLEVLEEYFLADGASEEASDSDSEEAMASDSEEDNEAPEQDSKFHQAVHNKHTLK